MFDRTSLREAAVALTLAGITGFVDSIGYSRLFGVFPANQSGNLILFGIALGDPDLGDAWRPGLSMLAFVVGVMIGVVLAHRVGPRRRMGTLLGIEAVLLVIVAAVAGDVSGRSAPYGGTTEVMLLTCAAVAMGVQTDVIRRAAQVGVWTTFTTGAMVQVTDEMTEAVVHHRAPADGGRRVLVVLGSVVVAYVAGAAVGSALVDGWGGALWAAVAAVAVMAAWAFVVPPGRGAQSEAWPPE